jgi:glycine cleavage system aminomethyltransferase T
MNPFTETSHAEPNSPLEDVLRRHGATMVNRDGRCLAAHYGSPTSEVAVCLTTVGIADRCDRTTLEVRAADRDIELALAALEPLRIRTWWSQLTSRSAIVRCEHGDTPACLEALISVESTVVVDVSNRYVAIALIGPRAADLLAACDLREAQCTPPIVLREARTAFEVLVPAAEGPRQWEQLLSVGGAFQIACVGLDALTQLAVSHRLDSSVFGMTLH